MIILYIIVKHNMTIYLYISQLYSQYIVHTITGDFGSSFLHLSQAVHPLPLTRPSDVFLVGVPGSGTTWLSHIMHGLRSDGSAMEAENLDVMRSWRS